MISVFKHELHIYFHSLTAYVFGAFLLLFIGIGAMMYNLQAAVSNFEYVLSFGSMVFIVIVPILTMRILAEERKQKTDQLLYSLPITATDVVLGKYLSLLLVYCLPLCLILSYPLIFAQYGEVYLPTSYGSVFAFFALGAALIAVGVFLSSLTDNQGFAAGMGIAVIAFNYFSVSLSEYVSSSLFGAAVSFFLLTLALWALVKHLTKDERLAYGVAIALTLALMATLWFGAASLEGLLPKIMKTLSLFERFEIFVSGIFDLTGLCYFLSVTVFFLFLSVQSLEKRRYN